jgi:pimeloyl-ACP methyl ester carboxylesterase
MPFFVIKDDGMSFQLQETYRQYESTTRLKVVYHRALAFHYVVSGYGRKPFLLLHGGAGTADTLFSYVVALQHQYRVITPTLPATDDIEALVSGIHAVLDMEFVEDSVHLYGASLGGLLAQALIQRDLSRFDGIILSNTTSPHPSYIPKLLVQRGLITVLPSQRLIDASVDGILKRMRRDIPNIQRDELQFWGNYLYHLYSTQVDKDMLVSRLDLQMQYHRNESHQLISGEHGKRILLLGYEKDRIFGESALQSLEGLYPRATVRVFPNYGHLGALVRPNDALQVISKFFLDSREIKE